MGGLNVGGFREPTEQRRSITVHNSISTGINCAFSRYLTVISTQSKSDSDNKHLRVSNPDLWVAEHIMEQISVSNPD